jgi:acetate---CoA ligase (ADP-forming)
VRLGCSAPELVREAFKDIMKQVTARAPGARVDGIAVQQTIRGVEMIVGTKVDPQFGPIVLVGAGGIFVETLGEFAMRLAPVTSAEAREMLAELRAAALLNGARGDVLRDTNALSDAISAISRLAAEQQDTIEALDINPIIVLPKGEGVVAIDWLVSLQERTMPTMPRGLAHG